MIVSNKIVLAIIVFSLGLIAAGAIGFITDNPNLHVLLKAGGFLFILSGGYLIIKNGTFIYSSEYRFIKLGIAVIIIGTLFKIMHWPFASAMFVYGTVSFAFVYLYYIVKNKHTRWSDFLKLFLILTLSTGRIFRTFCWPYSEEITIIGMIALLILLIDLIKTKKIHLHNQ